MKKKEKSQIYEKNLWEGFQLDLQATCEITDACLFFSPELIASSRWSYNIERGLIATKFKVIELF